MNLTVEQLMNHAIHFLRTGQPRMAELYMRRALELLQAQRVGEVVEDALSGLADAFGSIGAFFSELMAEMFGGGTSQSDFALEA